MLRGDFFYFPPGIFLVMIHTEVWTSFAWQIQQLCGWRYHAVMHLIIILVHFIT
jgi:hypothetical protein